MTWPWRRLKPQIYIHPFYLRPARVRQSDGVILRSILEMAFREALKGMYL